MHNFLVIFSSVQRLGLRALSRCNYGQLLHEMPIVGEVVLDFFKDRKHIEEDVSVSFTVAVLYTFDEGTFSADLRCVSKS